MNTWLRLALSFCIAAAVVTGAYFYQTSGGHSRSDTQLTSFAIIAAVVTWVFTGMGRRA